MLYLIATEGAEHHENGVHLAGDINEVIWGSIAFFVIVAVLVKLAGPAVSKAFTGRTARIEAELAAARTARDEAEASLTTSSSDLPDVGAEQERIRTEAVASAARLKDDLVARAHAEAEDILTRGRADIEAFRRQAVADLTAEMGRLTRESASDLVTDALDSDAHGDLIDSYISQLEQLS